MLILASNSPRRKQLLALGGWPFRVHPVNIAEEVMPGELPDRYVHRLCVEKAQAALLSPDLGFSHEDLILAADTAVAVRLDEPDCIARLGSDLPGTYRILGKPADRDEAEAILRCLRGKMHQVYTGLAVLRAADGRLLTDVVVTDVSMREYTDQEIQAYIASGDPFDKAGAYAIQHTGFHPVQKVHGCYANVMGLPVCHLADLLKEFNLPCKVGLMAACQQTVDVPCPIFSKII